MDKNNYNYIKSYVNSETGEIIPIENLEPVEIIRKTIHNFDNNALLQSPYFHLVAEQEANLLKQLNLNFADIGKVLFMLTYTGFREPESDKMYLRFDNKIIIDDSNISSLRNKLKINSEQFKRFKKRLMDNNIIFKDDKGYYFKDSLMIRGKVYGNEKKNLNLYRLYDNTVREIYDILTIENKLSSSKGLGVLLCLLPFMQKQNNVLMTKYYNETTGSFTPLKAIHIADALGIDRSTLSKEIKSMNKIAIQKFGRHLIYEVSLKAFGETDERNIQRAILLEPTFSYNSHGDNFNEVLDSLMSLTAFYPKLE